MTPKQQRFCDEYLIDLNATQAAIRAGYSEKVAKEIGYENLTKPHIKAYINKRMKSIEDKNIANIKEVKEFWTFIMRNENEETRERLKASEHIAKSYGAFIDKVKHSGDADNPIQHNIEGNINLVLNELEQLTDDEIDDIILATTQEVGAIK